MRINEQVRLRLNYTGDAARLYASGSSYAPTELLMDHWWNGGCCYATLSSLHHVTPQNRTIAPSLQEAAAGGLHVRNLRIVQKQPLFAGHAMELPLTRAGIKDTQLELFILPLGPPNASVPVYFEATPSQGAALVSAAIVSTARVELLVDM